MFVCFKSSNIEGTAGRSASNLISDVYRNYKRISLMNNLVSLNNNISHHIVRCFNSQYWSRFMHMA